MEIIFPVTGHSFLPADRVFALTEKKIRKCDTIVQPEEYEDIIKQHAQIFKLGSDVQIMDWKTSCREILKDTQHWNFQMSKMNEILDFV